MRKSALKIGVDISQIGGDRGGCNRVAGLLVREMAKLAPHHEFLLCHPFDKPTNEGNRKGIPLHAGNAFEQSRRWTCLEDAVWQTADKSSKTLPGTPDIVHTDRIQAPLVAPAKLVYTICDLGFWTHPELSSEENRLHCQRGVLDAIGRAAGVVFISQSLRNDFERILPDLLEEKGIKYAVASLASRFDSETQPRATLPSGDWLAVGALEPRKNYPRILRAFESYWEKSTIKRKLIIAGGDGWKSEELRVPINSLEQRGLVKNEGDVDAARLGELYASAFGLVFPSHYDGFALPIVEAMGQGCPVITRKNSSLAEIAGSAAIYCDDVDVEIAETMLRLERDEAYYLTTSQACWAQSSRFSWTATAGRVLELYEHLS